MINLRQREFLAFPCSQLVRGSTEDGVTKKTLASHRAVPRALVPGTSPGKVGASGASPRPPSSMAWRFPQISRTAEAFLVNGGCPCPSIILKPMHTFFVFEKGFEALHLPFTQTLGLGTLENPTFRVLNAGWGLLRWFLFSIINGRKCGTGHF